MHFPIKFTLDVFFQDITQLILYNTIKIRKDGMTYYDLKQFANIPSSKIYRMMKKLSEEGFLRVEEKMESGRPKHVYFLTKLGEKKKIEIEERLKILFNAIKESHGTEINYEDFFKSTFESWKSPLEHILHSDLSLEEKLEKLKKHEEHYKEVLIKLKKARIKLEKQKEEQKN